MQGGNSLWTLGNKYHERAYESLTPNYFQAINSAKDEARPQSRTTASIENALAAIQLHAPSPSIGIGGRNQPHF